MRTETMNKTMGMEIMSQIPETILRRNKRTWAHIGHKLTCRAICQVYYMQQTAVHLTHSILLLKQKFCI